MNRGFYRICCSLIAIPLVLTVTRLARAGDTPHLSGSYQVIRKTDLGPQTHVRLRVRLTNPGQRDLHIQRITLWDFSHPTKGATQFCSIVLRSQTSTEATLEFDVPRAEYELWKRGARPRVVLEIATTEGRTTTEAVRLNLVSGGEVN